MKHIVWMVVKGLSAVIFLLVGSALLIGEKTGAGIALIGVAAVIVLPFGWLIKNARIKQWVRAVVVVLFCGFAVVSVANTDIPPEDRTSGYPFIDQISVIAQDVRDKLSGRSGSTQNTPSGRPVTVTKEAAFEFTKCMRSHGVTNFPDPVFTNGVPSFQNTSETKASKETVQQAQASCEHILQDKE